MGVQYAVSVRYLGQPDLGKGAAAVGTVFLAAVAGALGGQQMAAAPACQWQESLMLKQLLLCHIHPTAPLVLHTNSLCCLLSI